MEPVFSDLELEIYNLRKRGYSYRYIADELGFRTYQRVQQIYKKSLDKKRKLIFIIKYFPELYKACKLCDFSYKQIFRLYELLRRLDILENYLFMDEDELLDLPRMGPKYVEVLRIAQDIYDAGKRKE